MATVLSSQLFHDIVVPSVWVQLVRLPYQTQVQQYCDGYCI